MRHQRATVVSRHVLEHEPSTAEAEADAAAANRLFAICETQIAERGGAITPENSQSNAARPEWWSGEGCPRDVRIEYTGNAPGAGATPGRHVPSVRRSRALRSGRHPRVDSEIPPEGSPGPVQVWIEAANAASVHSR